MKKKNEKELKINKRQKILVLSPHPDDESIGCGGFLLKYASQCDVILLTDGAKPNDRWDEDTKRKTRAKEFKAVMKYLGVHQFKMLGIPDSKLASNLECLKKIPYERYAYVLVPNLHEAHCDHNVIFPEVARIISQRHLQTKILQYEVWTPILHPTHYLDLTDLIVEKQRLIQLYKCPLMYIDYDMRITALAYYRALMYDCKYAECYRMSDHDLNMEQKLQKICSMIREILDRGEWMLS